MTIIFEHYIPTVDVDLQTIFQELPDDPNIWRINPQDKYSSRDRGRFGDRKRYFSQR